MQDYMKKNAQKGAQQNNESPVQAKTNGIPNSVLQDVFAGKRHADSSMMGHSQNLAPSIAAKMSRAFGMDLTGMQVYQSDAMKGTGMRGMAQGNKVVLSSDVNLNTTAGQAVLGHEISHIHAQSQGIGMGHSGLYENAALEHQADTEGLLAAQGRSIYSDGMDTGIGMQYGLGMQGVEGLTPLSGGMSASAGAPMQAWKLSDLFLSKDARAGKAKNPANDEQANAYVYEYAKKLQDSFTDKYGKKYDSNISPEAQKNYDKSSALEMGLEYETLQNRLKDFVYNMPIPKDTLDEFNAKNEIDHKLDSKLDSKFIEETKDINRYYDEDDEEDRKKSVSTRNNERKVKYRENLLNKHVGMHDNWSSNYDFSVTNSELQKEMKDKGLVTPSPFKDMLERLNAKIVEEKEKGKVEKKRIDKDIDEHIYGGVHKGSSTASEIEKDTFMGKLSSIFKKKPKTMPEKVGLKVGLMKPEIENTMYLHSSDSDKENNDKE